MERRCSSVLRFRLKWSLILIPAICDSKPVSVIASVSLIGVDGTVLLADKIVERGGVGVKALKLPLSYL
jgi:hypothetical protein